MSYCWSIRYSQYPLQAVNVIDLQAVFYKLRPALLLALCPVLLLTCILLALSVARVSHEQVVAIKPLIKITFLGLKHGVCVGGGGRGGGAR